MANGENAILLVEDTDDDILLIQRAFKKAKVTAPLHIVRDGEAACGYLRGEGKYSDREKYPLPGLILLDLNLPLRSGVEVLQWLRAQAILRRIPVVVLTSSDQTTDIQRAYDAGANSYLVKPVSFETMQEMAHALGLYWIEYNEAPK